MNREAHPASPCTGVCSIDPVTQACRGCARTLAEIGAWLGASAAEKRGILDAVAQRSRG